LINRKPSPPVNLWKYIGDEVVLMAELGKEHPPSLYVLALAETIKYFNSCFETEKTFKDGKLKLYFKGTAWVAGFPASNIELKLTGKDHEENDFIGPSIDLGFRLSKFATKDKLIISASLVFLIINQLDTKEQQFNFPLCFGCFKKVKGIKNKHPLIWHPINKTNKRNMHLIQPKKLLRILKKNYFDLSIFPFIPDTDNSDVTLEYDEYYKKAVEEQIEIQGSPFFGMENLKKLDYNLSSNSNIPEKCQY